MKVDNFMTCRFGIGSITQAQIALNILTQNGLTARIIKLDARKSPRGCAYGLELDEKDKARASQTLRRARIKFSEA